MAPQLLNYDPQTGRLNGTLRLSNLAGQQAQRDGGFFDWPAVAALIVTMIAGARFAATAR